MQRKRPRSLIGDTAKAALTIAEYIHQAKAYGESARAAVDLGDPDLARQEARKAARKAEFALWELGWAVTGNLKVHHADLEGYF